MFTSASHDLLASGDEGAPPRAIQELAGHQDLTTTQRYMHLTLAALVSAIKLLDKPGPAEARHYDSGRGEIGEAAGNRAEIADFLREIGGGGGSRSAPIVGFSNDFENSMGSIGKERQKAVVWVQNRYRKSASVS